MVRGGDSSNAHTCTYRFGIQERIFRMEYISNSAFTDQEFAKWKSEVLNIFIEHVIIFVCLT